MNNKKFIYLFITIYLLTMYLIPADKWQKVDKGLDWNIFNIKHNMETFKFYVLRINPKLYSLHLLSAKEKSHTPLSLKQWSKKYNLIAGINASMYLPDKLKSTGYMKNFNFFNNKRINKRFSSFIAFNPKNKHSKPAIIIEKNSINWKVKLNRYNTVIQNYRIIDAKQKIRWGKKNMSAIATFGIDNSGNVLFIFSSQKIATYDFAKIILNLPLRVYNLSYLEGGYEASLYINHNNFQFNLNGNLFNSARINKIFINPPLPNIIGIRKK